MKFAALVLVVLSVSACMNPAPPAVEGDTGVTLTLQSQDNWCWLAVTEMIGRAVTGLDVPQCEMAGADCCDPDKGASAECDKGGMVPWTLESAYGLKSELVPYNADTLRAEILAGRPVGIDYFAASGQGHSTVITAYSLTQGFKKLDPKFGVSWVSDASTWGEYHAARMVLVR